MDLVAIPLRLYVEFETEIYAVQRELINILPKHHVVEAREIDGAIEIEGSRDEIQRAATFAKGFAMAWNRRTKDVHSTFYHGQ